MEWPTNPKVVLGILIGVATGMGVTRVPQLFPKEAEPTAEPVKTRLLTIRMIHLPKVDPDGGLKTKTVPVEIENLSGHSIALPMHDHYRCVVIKPLGSEITPRKLVPSRSRVTAQDFVVLKPNQTKRVNFRVKVLGSQEGRPLEAVPIVMNVPPKHLSAKGWAAVKTKLRKDRAYLWGSGTIHGPATPIKNP